ncbi:TPR-like protein, partial [Auriscalpium vulgare]
FEHMGRIADLEEVIMLKREALNLTPPGHPTRSACLMNLANSLNAQFQQLGGRMSDLEEAIQLYREALNLSPPGHPLRSKGLNNLGSAVHTRFEQLGKMSDLEETILLHREALNLLHPGHPDLSKTLHGLANAKQTKFGQLGGISDLEEAILLLREALHLVPSGHPERSMYLSNLACAVHAHFKQLGLMSDLEEGIHIDREALDLVPPGHLDRPRLLMNLGSSILTRFDQLGRISDLEEAVLLARDALHLRPPDHPNRSLNLSNLAATLWTQFEHFGRTSDLEEIIQLNREALNLRPPGHPGHSLILTNLAIAVQTRFKQLGRILDLEEAILLHREALKLVPLGHPEHSTELDNLACAVRTQFDHLGTISDLEEAILLHREALNLRPLGHPDRSISLNNLAIAMHARFKKLDRMSDINEAILLYREALNLRPTGNPGRAISLNNMASAMQERFGKLGNIPDLEEAILLHREALNMRPPGQPYRLVTLNNLALAVRMRFAKLGGMSDLEEAMSIQAGPNISDQAWKNFEQASNYIYASTKTRLEFTLIWAKLAHQYQHNSARQAYEKALLLLEQCSTLFPTPQLQHSFFQTVEGTSELASNAVSWAIGSGDLMEAVEVWEQGRGILWSKMRNYRYPIEELKSINAVLAEQFEDITGQLDVLTTTYDAEFQSLRGQIFERQLTRKRELNERWNDLVTEIQGVPGFETFLTIPSFLNIRKVASEGPVILVNISTHRSDAMILYDVVSDPINVPLPDTSKGTVFEIVGWLAKGLKLGHLSNSPAESSTLARDDTSMNETIHKVLSHLWEYIVCHIFQKLDKLGLAKNSRLWWCLSGKLCTLPIHAAQPFFGPQQKLSQKYIHSYTSTLSSLIRAREDIDKKERRTIPKILAIATSSLPKVYEEIGFVENMGCDVQKLIGSKVTHDTMIDGLSKSPWIHFASHGHLDAEQPFKSSFELHDNARFTILDLMKANLPNAELAVLSACHTAAVDQDNTPDEGISLAAGMQFCGFRGVVGTLWAMDDNVGPILAKEFYKRMIHPENPNKPVDFKDAAKVLKAVTKEMRRNEELNALHFWVPLVHIGA